MQSDFNPMHQGGDYQAAFDIKELKHDCIYLSYNLDNHNPAPETVAKLFSDFLSHYTVLEAAPDFVMIGLQEAKRSFTRRNPVNRRDERTFFKGENLAERLMKRWNLSSAYTVICNGSRYAFTHPDLAKNWANRSFTHLFIACKTSLLNSDLVIRPASLECDAYVEGLREQKGGLFTKVQVKDSANQLMEISFSTVHLDSHNPVAANRQLQAVATQCNTLNMLAGGDFNTRAHIHVTGRHAVPRNRSSLLNGAREHSFNRACFEAHLADQMTALSGFRPHLPGDITYSKVRDNALIPYNDARGAMDFGALDFFIMKGEAIDRHLTKEHATVIDLKDGAIDINPSDHKPVMGKFVILRQTIASFFDRINAYYQNNMAAIFTALSADEDTLLRYLAHAVTIYRLDILTAYFSHAQVSSSSSSSLAIPCFTNVNLAMRVVLIVLDNLASLRGRADIPVTADYIPNTYGQCERIEAQMQEIAVKPSDYRYGKFMLDCFNKLLDERTACPDIVRIGLLLPFWRWLEGHNISHAGYGYKDEDQVTVFRGAFFELAANTQGNRYVSPDARYVECGKR